MTFRYTEGMDHNLYTVQFSNLTISLILNKRTIGYSAPVFSATVL